MLGLTVYSTLQRLLQAQCADRLHGGAHQHLQRRVPPRLHDGRPDVGEVVVAQLQQREHERGAPLDVGRDGRARRGRALLGPPRA